MNFPEFSLHSPGPKEMEQQVMNSYTQPTAPPAGTGSTEKTEDFGSNKYLSVNISFSVVFGCFFFFP